MPLSRQTTGLLTATFRKCIKIGKFSVTTQALQRAFSALATTPLTTAHVSSKCVPPFLGKVRFFSTEEHETKPRYETVKLKNQAVIPKILVVTTMMNLNEIWKNHRIAFYDLVCECRYPDHKMFRNTQEILKKFALMDSRSLHNTTRDIICSAVEGYGLNMTFGSPYEEAPDSRKCIR